MTNRAGDFVPSRLFESGLLFPRLHSGMAWSSDFRRLFRQKGSTQFTASTECVVFPPCLRACRAGLLKRPDNLFGFEPGIRLRNTIIRRHKAGGRSSTNEQSRMRIRRYGSPPMPRTPLVGNDHKSRLVSHVASRRWTPRQLARDVNHCEARASLPRGLDRR